MVTLVDDRADTTDIAQQLRQIQPGIVPRSDSDLYDLLATYSDKYTNIYDAIDEQYEQRLVESATGSHLDRLGARYGIQRNTGEGDDALRTRIVATRKASLSNGSYTDVADVAATALDTDPTNLNVRRPRDTGGAGLAEIQVSGNIISNAPLSQSTAESITDDAALAGHRVTIQQTNVFTFGDPNNGFGTEWAFE